MSIEGTGIKDRILSKKKKKEETTMNETSTVISQLNRQRTAETIPSALPQLEIGPLSPSTTEVPVTIHTNDKVEARLLKASGSGRSANSTHGYFGKV
jgi:hypothetical protein